jgi:hypothetical protein
MSHVTVKQTQIPAGDLPESVISSSSEELGGEVEGTIEPAMPTSKRLAAFAYKIKGATLVKPPTGVPSGFSEALIRVEQNAAGGHALSTSGITWNGGEPVWKTTANAVNIISIFTTNGGSSWEAVGPEEGKKGEKGAEGKEGTAIGLGLLLKLTKAKVYKNTTETATEEKPVLAESQSRNSVTTTFALASGTPVFSAIEVPAKTLISALGFYVATLEETPANRTHLWVALLNSKLELVLKSLDYTSSANTPLFAAAPPRALKFTATHESGSEAEVYYGLLCEVMSSTKPIVVGATSAVQGLSSSAEGREPYLSGLGETGRTTPESLAATVVPSGGASARPYMVLL